MKASLIIIGGGPAGTAAALAGRELGLVVTLVEPRLRSVRADAERILAEDLVARPLSHAPEDRLEDGWLRAVRRAGEVAAGLRDERDRRLARAGVSRLAGLARLPGEPGVVVVDLGAAGIETLHGTHVLVATGARRLALASPATVAALAALRAGLLNLAVPPLTAVVVGAGVEGVMLAGLLACAGTEVTLLESRERVLPEADADLSSAVGRSLAAAGTRVETGTTAASIEREESGLAVAVHAATGEAGTARRIVVDQVFVAAGREPVLPECDDSALALALRSEASTGGHATEHPWLLRAGSTEGRIVGPEAAVRAGRAAAAEVAGRPRPVPRDAVPVFVQGAGGCGWCGLSEREATVRGHSVLVGRAKLAGRGRVPPGFVKLVAGRSSGRILGVHVAGSLGREAVALASLLVERGVSRADLATLALPAGSPGEALVEAARTAAAP